MRFARRVFGAAGVYGLLALLPQYFLEERIGRDYPPPITHPEHFYGFIGVAVAWQVLFFLIARDPARFRPAMPVAVLEKLVFAVPAMLLFASGRVPGAVLGFGVTAWFLAHQLLDGPMSRRAMGFSEKMGFLHGHLPWILGLGASGTLVMMVPVLNLLGLPVLVAGGAVLWVELERDRSV